MWDLTIELSPLCLKSDRKFYNSKEWQTILKCCNTRFIYLKLWLINCLLFKLYANCGWWIAYYLNCMPALSIYIKIEIVSCMYCEYVEWKNSLSWRTLNLTSGIMVIGKPKRSLELGATIKAQNYFAISYQKWRIYEETESSINTLNMQYV